MTAKVLYDKRGEVAYITLNRSEVKTPSTSNPMSFSAISGANFRDDPELRVAVITGSGDAFHRRRRPEKLMHPSGRPSGRWSDVSRLRTVCAASPRGPLSRITKAHRRRDQRLVRRPWGRNSRWHVTSESPLSAHNSAPFEVRRGMHPADGSIPRLVNTCGVGCDPGVITHRRADFRQAGAHTAETWWPEWCHTQADEGGPDAVVQHILRCDQGRESNRSKETVLENHRPAFVRTSCGVTAMWGYALCGGNVSVMERSQQFFDKVDRGRAGGDSYFPSDLGASTSVRHLRLLEGGTLAGEDVFGDHTFLNLRGSVRDQVGHHIAEALLQWEFGGVAEVTVDSHRGFDRIFRDRRRPPLAH